MGARRALARWSWRTVRREWRQQLLILSLIGISMGVASVVSVLVYHGSAPRSSFRGEATHEISVWGEFTGPVLTELETGVREAFPTADVSFSRNDKLNGTSILFPVRDLPSTQALGAEPVRLLEGRLPTRDGELAVSTKLATISRLSLDDRVSLGPGDFTVVGLIEDPGQLWAPFAVVDHVSEPDSLVALVNSNDSDINAFINRTNASDLGQAGHAFSTDLAGTGERRIALAATTIFASLIMLEVALLCSAGFVVLAQRRIRQFGLLGAVGATPRHLRQALRLNGIILGFTGGAIGVVLGYLVSLATRPLLESVLTQRVESWEFPWTTQVPLVAVATLTGLLASWWPAKNLARVPIVAALAARPVAVRSTSRWAIGGGFAFGLGAAALSYSVRVGRPFLSAAALAASILGLLALTPALVAAAGRLASRLPLAGRIALRDLSRHPQRTASALAALVVAVGLPVGIVLINSSENARTGSTQNLPADWAIIMPPDAQFGGHVSTTPPLPPTAAVTSILPDAALTPIALAIPIGLESEFSEEGLANAVTAITNIEFDDGSGYFESNLSTGPTWVATPELMDALDLDAELALASASVISDSSEPVHLGFWSVVRDPESGEITGQTVPKIAELSPYRSIPSHLIPEASLSGQELEAVTVGWLVTNPTPITDSEATQLAAAMPSASGQRTADALAVELYQPNQDDARFRWITLGIGSLVAAAIIAAMIGLLRVDSAGDDRTLAAVGAASSVRRSIVASSTAFLAFGGALLGLPAGYLGLLAVMSDRRSGYPLVFPIAELSALLIGLPLAATAVAFMLVRSEPRHLAAVPRV